MKKFLVLLSLSLICLISLVSIVPSAKASGTVDQYCMNTNLSSYESLKRNGVGSNYRQAFTPTQNRINQIAVKVGGPPAGVSGTAIVRIYTAPTGFDNELLRSDRAFNGLNAPETWYFNDFGDITLTPGTTYYISLVSSVDFLYWYSVDAGDCAPSGMAYKDGTQTGYKLHYSTFGSTVATPAADQGSTGNQTSTASSTTTGEKLGTTTASIVKPNNLTAAYSDTEKGVKLDWKASTTADIDGYKVFRSESATSGYTKVNQTKKDILTLLDSTATAGKTYYYQVRAYKADAQSVSSNTASAAVPADAAPAKPVNFKVVDRTFSMLTVMWRKSADTSISSYTLNLYRGGEKIRSADVPATVQSYSFLELDSGTMYKIDLVAKNAAGVSSTPAVTFGSTEFPEAIEKIMDTTRTVAAIVVLVLFLLLAINTARHYKKK